MSRLFQFDKALFSKHQAKFLVGIDEVGRGPLAGPVVAAAVVLQLPLPSALQPVRDSKVLNPQARERLFSIIRQLSIRSAVAWAFPEEIDHHNIFRASLLAMSRAFVRLQWNDPAMVAVIDGPWQVPGLVCRQEPIISGDAKSLSVACASIIAKVVRDRWMERLHRLYPEYGFSAHKGYATSAHLEALNRLGPSPIHRKSFEPVAKLIRPMQTA